MCLAIPAKVIELHDHDTATVDVGGVRKQVNVTLLPDLDIGDYVIVHVGFALSRVDASEAEQTLALFAELGGMAAGDVR